MSCVFIAEDTPRADCSSFRKIETKVVDTPDVSCHDTRQNVNKYVLINVAWLRPSNRYVHIDVVWVRPSPKTYEKEVRKTNGGDAFWIPRCVDVVLLCTF